MLTTVGSQSWSCFESAEKRLEPPEQEHQQRQQQQSEFDRRGNLGVFAQSIDQGAQTRRQKVNVDVDVVECDSLGAGLHRLADADRDALV